MFIGLFVLIVLQAPWMALIFGILAGLVAVWFVRGWMGEIDTATEAVVDRVMTPPTGPGPPAEKASETTTEPPNHYERLRRLSELRQEGHISAEEYEEKRREILREL